MTVKELSAIERAKEYGIDITLLESSLRMTIDQRLQRLQEWAMFTEEVNKARKQLYPDSTEDDSIRRVAEGSRK